MVSDRACGLRLKGFCRSGIHREHTTNDAKLIIDFDTYMLLSSQVICECQDTLFITDVFSKVKKQAMAAAYYIERYAAILLGFILPRYSLINNSRICRGHVIH